MATTWEGMTRTTNSIRLVSWDVDGTLYSISRMKWHLMKLFLNHMFQGRARLAAKELAALGRYRSQVDSVREAGGILSESYLTQNQREALLETETRWYGPAIHKAGPRKDVVEVISFFASRGIPQVVLSDYEAAYKLDSLGLTSRFASIYVGERLGFVKPNARGFQHIAADYQISAADILHIGDRIDRDDAAARAAGCQRLILGQDFRSFGQLLAKLQRDFPRCFEKEAET
ncbi:MAG TPA: HAD family hydrolase [Pyrinomonadaceae bacterium]|nr:HAD family hydrolase [Pyrinomonadaceae bacterium]